MNLETFYQKTMPVFGLSTVSEDKALALHIGEDITPLKIKEKPVYLPSRTVIDKGISDEFMVYHPAHEDVTGPLSLAIEATIKVTSLYYSFTLLAILGAIVETISAEENIESLDPAIKSLLMDVYKFPPLTRNDAQHIGNCLQSISTLEDLHYVVDVNVRKTKPTQEGLRYGTVVSRFLEAVNTAVKDDATSIAGVTMSKRSIKALQQIVSSLLPAELFTPFTNERTSCPAYEVVWTIASRFAAVVNNFRMFIDEPAERLDEVANSVNEDIIHSLPNKKLSGVIATVGSTEGNKPLKKVKRNIDLNVGGIHQAAPPVQQHPVQQQPPQTQYHTPLPQQQPARVESNNEYAELPNWMQTSQFQPQVQSTPQGYIVVNGQQVPVYPNQQVQAPPQGYIVPNNQQVVHQQTQTVPQGYVVVNGQLQPLAPATQQVVYATNNPAPPQQYVPYTSPGYVGTR